MITEIDYKTTGVGEVLDYKEMRNRVRTVWGGVSWPSKRPGFVVVLAMDSKEHFDTHDIYLLDEYESFDTREIVWQMGVMDAQYGILRNDGYLPDTTGQWVGDYKNEAAAGFIDEMNKQLGSKYEQMVLDYTILLEMKNVYSFILPLIKDLLDTERRTLYLKDSKVIDYLSEIEETEIADLKIGEFPAIEALGLTVFEMGNQMVSESMPSKPYHYDNDPLNGAKL